MEARSHSLIRFKQILFTADAENLSASLVGERRQPLICQRAVVRLLREIAAKKSVEAPAPPAGVEIDRINSHVRVISPPKQFDGGAVRRRALARINAPAAGLGFQIRHGAPSGFNDSDIQVD